MGLFGKLFKNDGKDAKGETAVLPWQMLTSKQQLDEIELAPKKVVVFKHSTRCGISRMVLKRFEKEYDFSEDQFQPYLLDLLNHRELSQEIASRFGVVHESPQLLMLKNGKIVHHASHHGIVAADLEAFV